MLKALFVSIAVVAYLVLTFGQAYIHSDIATATLLSNSIIKHRNFFPTTWNYANGEIWVLNNGLFCILPTWCACVCFTYFEIREEWHNVNIMDLTQLVLVDSLEAVWSNIIYTILNIFNSFGYGSHQPFPSIIGLRDLISVIMCVIVCFIIPYLQWKVEGGQILSGKKRKLIRN